MKSTIQLMPKHCFTVAMTLLIFSFYCCSQKEGNDTASETTAVESEQTIDNENVDEVDEYANYFLVIAGKGDEYGPLQDLMKNISNSTGITIDTMGRYYDAAKKRIVLPEDDEDEMYAGDYFPRRFPSEELSIEHLSFYQSGAGEYTMILVAGIFEESASADSVLRIINAFNPDAFVLESKVYIGCMH
jgi:hypothetical protein